MKKRSFTGGDRGARQSLMRVNYRKLRRLNKTENEGRWHRGLSFQIQGWQMR